MCENVSDKKFTRHQEKRIKEYNKRRGMSCKLMRKGFEKYGLKPTS
jgi:hypothetical protein